ncbi:mating-type protein MAT alpha 1 [Zopfia rhizophila CBS 207.26]|uniref:Mating-type protein MAT-1 n=1 Tax=Zopfia rhizophila CBS 207.26 TaxID=1314779 RepID=A0A6A6E537_9PEZI|nr:mating-type protein MAT alpha 1 [Zopfia rhizophila CBS 207.26]
MKKLSRVLSIMWDDDPYKALWFLMTKAWSIIRDRIGKGKAPLNQFFDIICIHLKPFE